MQLPKTCPVQLHHPVVTVLRENVSSLGLETQLLGKGLRWEASQQKKSEVAARSSFLVSVCKRTILDF